MKKYTLLTFLVLISAAVVFNGCKRTLEEGHEGESASEHAHHEGEHGANMKSATAWQDSLELFAEWTPFVAGESSNAHIHLSDLRTGEPIRKGRIIVIWKSDGNIVKTEQFENPTIPGILNASFDPPPAGHYEWIFRLESDSLQGEVSAGIVWVYGSKTDVPIEHDHPSDQEVTFLKEQQWMLGVQTAVVSRTTLYENIPALGEIKAAQFGEAEVFAPFDGVLMPDPDHGNVRPGETVRRGEVIAQLVPHGGLESGWEKLVNDYQLAKADYNRVQRLSAQGAVSEKRLQEASAHYRELRAQVRGALNVSDNELDEVELDGDHFHLRVPAGGVLADFHLRYGQHVEVGEHLFSVVDPSRIWLEAQMPASEAAKLEGINGAYFKLSGSDVMWDVSDFDGRLISASNMLDAKTRRFPIIFELDNSEGLLKPGSYAQIYVRSKVSRDALAIPEQAVLYEDGLSIVYVQTGGETFEKQSVRTGMKDGTFIEILSGLDEGERVVSEEAYKIRLASLKIGSASDAHGHAH